MATTSFTIKNSTHAPMIIGFEPEATEWEFPVNEEILIETNACTQSIEITTHIIKGQLICKFGQIIAFTKSITKEKTCSVD